MQGSSVVIVLTVVVVCRADESPEPLAETSPPTATAAPNDHPAPHWNPHAVLDDRGLERHRRAAHLALDTLLRQSVHRVTAFVCWGREDAPLHRFLSSAGMSVQFLRGANYATADILTAELTDSPYHAGVILDAACPFADRLLTLASRLRLFCESNVWVIFESGSLGTVDSGAEYSDHFADDFTEVDSVPVLRFGAQDMADAIDPNEPAFLEIDAPVPQRVRQTQLQPQTQRLSPHALRILDQRVIYVDSHVFWVQADGQRAEAFEVFRSCMVRPLQAYLVAWADLRLQQPHWRWTMTAYQESELMERRSDLEGSTLRGSMIIRYPEEYTHIEDLNLRKNDLFSKMSWPVCQNLAYSLNFGMLIYMRDNSGYSDGNGTYDGMMGELQRYEQDMVATAVLLREDRLPVVDTVAATFHQRTAILFRQPSKSSVSNVYLLPFSTGVWHATAVVSLLTLLLLTIQTQWWRHNHSKQTNEPGDHLDVGDCVTFTVGALSQQGFYCAPSIVSARITFITMFMANVFLFTSFSGSIVAIIQSPSNALRSVEDLIVSDMHVHVQDIRYTHVWFEEAEAENDVAAEVFRKKIKTHKAPGFVVTREGIRSVRRGKHAFLVETNEGYKEILDTFVEAEKCDLAELELFPTAPRVMCTTEKSPYREAAARNVLRQRETGLLSRIQSRWESQRPECSGLSQAFVPIGLQEFYPALIVVYNGALLAAAVLLAERLFNSESVRRRRAVSWSVTICGLGPKARPGAKAKAF